MKRSMQVVYGLLASVLGAAALAQPVTDEQRSAIRSACRSDYSSVCASVPTGGMAALQCLQQHSQQVSAGCQKALAAVPTNAPPVAPASAAAAAAATPAPSAPAAAATAQPSAAAPPARARSPREEARMLRSECGGDFQKLCSDAGLGGGRGAACLRAHASQLSPRCSSLLSSMAPK